MKTVKQIRQEIEERAAAVPSDAAETLLQYRDNLLAYLELIKGRLDDEWSLSPDIAQPD